MEWAGVGRPQRSATCDIVPAVRLNQIRRDRNGPRAMPRWSGAAQEGATHEHIATSEPRDEPGDGRSKLDGALVPSAVVGVHLLVIPQHLAHADGEVQLAVAARLGLERVLDAVVLEDLGVHLLPLRALASRRRPRLRLLRPTQEVLAVAVQQEVRERQPTRRVERHVHRAQATVEGELHGVLVGVALEEVQAEEHVIDPGTAHGGSVLRARHQRPQAMVVELAELGAQAGLVVHSPARCHDEAPDVLQDDHRRMVRCRVRQDATERAP
eukprot:15469784-Alexandrium_andersonii.AAC.1